mmetsp:Transcript_33379/g.89339  ORF Transcript_33379/g.89339 Transcript_33379/m.89339 type:complete len:369 (+) Transcript_33379:439-1545(+)
MLQLQPVAVHVYLLRQASHHLCGVLLVAARLLAQVRRQGHQLLRVVPQRVARLDAEAPCVLGELRQAVQQRGDLLALRLVVRFALLVLRHHGLDDPRLGVDALQRADQRRAVHGGVPQQRGAPRALVGHGLLLRADALQQAGVEAAHLVGGGGGAPMLRTSAPQVLARAAGLAPLVVVRSHEPPDVAQRAAGAVLRGGVLGRAAGAARGTGGAGGGRAAAALSVTVYLTETSRAVIVQASFLWKPACQGLEIVHCALHCSGRRHHVLLHLQERRRARVGLGRWLGSGLLLQHGLHDHGFSLDVLRDLAPRLLLLRAGGLRGRLALGDGRQQRLEVGSPALETDVLALPLRDLHLDGRNLGLYLHEGGV